MPFDVIAQSEFFFWGIILLNASATHIMGGTKTPTAEDFRNLHSLKGQNLKMIFPVEDDILHS